MKNLCKYSCQNPFIVLYRSNIGTTNDLHGKVQNLYGHSLIT